MEPTSHVVTQLDQVIDAPKQGITSSAIHTDADTRVVLFVFQAGEELSEHTASTPAIIHVLEGQAEVTLGSDAHQAGPGFWAYMDAKLPHSLKAKTPMRMLLTLLRSAGKTE